MSYDWAPERYRTRQPTCWDPPWTRRTTAYQHSSSYELDMYSPSPPRHRPTCWDQPVYRETPRLRPFNEVSVYDQPLAPDSNSRWNQPYTARDTAAPLHTFPRRYSVRGPASQQPRSAILAEDPIGRPSDEGHNDDSIGNKLDRLMDRFDKLEAWREETDRRFENLEPAIPREFSQPRDCDDGGELEYEDYRCKRNWDSNHHMGSVQTRRPTCWDPPGNRPLPSFQPYDPPQSRRPSCWEPSLMATPVVDQKPPLQHVLDQQSPPSHRRAAAPLAPAAAPPPLLHVDQQPSPSCCHPTTHLRQAGACLELPTTVQQPLLQRPPPLPLPRSDHPPQPSPATPLELLPYSAPRPAPPMHPLSVTVPLLVSNGHSQVVPSSQKKE